MSRIEETRTHTQYANDDPLEVKSIFVLIFSLFIRNFQKTRKNKKPKFFQKQKFFKKLNLKKIRTASTRVNDIAGATNLSTFCWLKIFFCLLILHYASMRKVMIFPHLFKAKKGLLKEFNNRTQFKNRKIGILRYTPTKIY